jgi:hypothetical protein
MSNKFGSINLLSNGNTLELYCAPSLAANYALAFPPAAPTDAQFLRYNTTLGRFEWVNTSAISSNVNLTYTAPTAEFAVTGSPYTGGTGTIAIDWKNQTQNLLFASPSGSTGKPLFRALVDADLPTTISASKISGTLAKANIPDGTTATSFQIDSGNNGVVLKNDTTSLRIFNSNQSALADLYCNKLFVLNGIDQSNVTTVNLGDSTLLLNSEFTTGTPTVNTALSTRRGSSVNATFQWNEGTDLYEAGTDDNLKPLARKSQVTITNADIVSGSYTFTHNLRERYPVISVSNNLNQQVGVGVTFTNTNTATIDFSRLTPLTGSWIITAVG